mmetsp:Transcript_33509/g.89624  ORF Transcript_33509/g.89624 Transcript_33509/m.89624 type:complete len:285 (-) Transcript_33509:176-1030(-)
MSCNRASSSACFARSSSNSALSSICILSASCNNSSFSASARVWRAHNCSVAARAPSTHVAIPGACATKASRWAKISGVPDKPSPRTSVGSVPDVPACLGDDKPSPADACKSEARSTDEVGRIATDLASNLATSCGLGTSRVLLGNSRTAWRTLAVVDLCGEALERRDPDSAALSVVSKLEPRILTSELCLLATSVELETFIRPGDGLRSSDCLGDAIDFRCCEEAEEERANSFLPLAWSRSGALCLLDASDAGLDLLRAGALGLLDVSETRETRDTDSGCPVSS